MPGDVLLKPGAQATEATELFGKKQRGVGRRIPLSVFLLQHEGEPDILTDQFDELADVI